MKKPSIYMPIEFEHLLTRLFGQAYSHSVGPHSLSSWKRICLRILAALRRAISINVDSDSYHRNALIQRCTLYESDIRKAKSGNAASTVLISLLVETNLMLLGHLPNNFRSKSVSNPQQWKFDEFRKLVYVQSPEQRANLILSLTESSSYSKRLPDYSTLHEKLYGEFKGDHGQFISWFKQEYRDIYLEIV